MRRCAAGKGLGVAYKTWLGNRAVISLVDHPRYMSAYKNFIFPYPVSISDKGFKAEVTLPGYGFADISRAGNVDVWSTLRADESVRVRMLLDPSSPISGLLDKRLAFLVSQHHDYLPAFYNTRNHFQPIQHTHRIVHTGKSSVQYRQTNTSQESGELLHCNSSVLVMVDESTRKAIPLPTSIVERFKQSNLFGVAPPMEQFLSKPSRGHFLQGMVQVQPSDTDSYFHTNQASYPRLCHNVGSMLAASGKLSQFPKDLAFFRVKDLKCLYQGESSAGDQLTVTLWECGERVLKFIVEKRGTPVFQCVMEFFQRGPI